MFGTSAEIVKNIKNRYPQGCRVICNYCADIYNPITQGEKGTVDFVDDMGTVHIKWDNGRYFGMCLEEDSISKI